MRFHICIRQALGEAPSQRCTARHCTRSTFGAPLIDVPCSCIAVNWGCCKFFLAGDTGKLQGYKETPTPDFGGSTSVVSFRDLLYVSNAIETEVRGRLFQVLPLFSVLKLTALLENLLSVCYGYMSRSCTIH